MATTDVTNQRPVFKSAEEFYAWDQANKAKAPQLPPAVSPTSPVNPVSGSSVLRQEENKVRFDAADILKTVTDKSVADTMAEIKNLTGYRDPNAAFSESELASINSAAENEGAKYNPEITKAEEAFRKGMPQAEISSGERGGFMSTQFAGMAAVTPTAGGTFVGQGGELKNIEDTYNANINNLKVAQKQAMALAKQKAEEAIRTGKSESNKQAMELFKAAQDANTKAIELAQKKVDLVSSYQKSQEAKIKFNTDFINEKAAVGQPLDATDKASVDEIYGQGWADKYYEISKKTAEAKTSTEQVKNLQGIYNLMKDVPIGTQKTFGDTTFEGQYSPNDNDAVYKVTTKSGEVALITLDKATGTTKTILTNTFEKQGGSGGGATTKSYFTSPDATGKTQYYFGDPKNPAGAQVIPEAEYIKAKSIGAGLHEPEVTDEQFISDLKEQATNSKAGGEDKDTFIARFVKDNGGYPNADEQAAIDEAYQGYFGNLWDSITGN